MNKKYLLIIILVCVIVGIATFFIVKSIINKPVEPTNTVSSQKYTNPYEITDKLNGIYAFREQNKSDTGHIYNTIGAFSFKDGNFTVKYYLNDHYNNLIEETGFYGYDSQNKLILNFNYNSIFEVIEENNNIYYKGQISNLNPIEDPILLTKVDTNIEETLEKLKLEVATEELYHNESIRWLMSKEELDGFLVKETDEMTKNKIVTYATNKHSKYNNYFGIEKTAYSFNDKQLKAYWHIFEKESCTYNNYKKIKDILVSKYGEPDIEDFNWIDTTYKDNPEKWNDAFRYSDFTIDTIWNNQENMYIEIKWDYDNSCNLIYCEKGFENNL